MRVGFIGIGRMGHGMAKRILDAGHELTIYDTNPKALEELSSNGAIAATSIAETVENREVTITMLPTDEALEELTFSKNGLRYLPCHCSGVGKPARSRRVGIMSTFSVNSSTIFPFGPAICGLRIIRGI